MPLTFALWLWMPVHESGSSCTPDQVCPAGESDSVGTSLQFIVVTGGIELAAIGCYLAVTAVRGTLQVRDAQRWLPIAVALLVLAVGPMELDDDNGTLLFASFAVWFVAPLVLYGVHRGDAGATIPVILALTPTAALGGLIGYWEDFEYAYFALPAIMVIAMGVFVGVRRVSSRR